MIQRKLYFAVNVSDEHDAFGRATSFVVSFVLAFSGVNIVAINAILVLHVGKTGRRTVGRTPLGLHGPSRCDTTMDDQDRTELHY